MGINIRERQRKNHRDTPAGDCPDASRHVLWCVWLTWGLALVLWVNAGDGGLRHHLLVSVTAGLLWFFGCGLRVYILTGGKRNMQLLKKKKPDAVPDVVSTGEPAEVPPPSLPAMPVPGALKDVVVTAVRKDVFIAHGAHLSGEIEAEGNIVAEGCIEGTVRATHQVRVDAGGMVKGDIHAAQIIINGQVTGRCYAGSVSLLEQGRIEGDVFTDELAIERGGVFTGQSCPPAPRTTGSDREGEKGARRDAPGGSTRKAGAPEGGGRDGLEVAG